MATQQYWMTGTPTTAIQVIATVNTSGPHAWQTTQIEVKNSDPTHSYTFTVTGPSNQQFTWTQPASSDTTQAVTIQMQAPQLNDDGTMGSPSWPAGWSVQGTWD